MKTFALVTVLIIGLFFIQFKGYSLSADEIKNGKIEQLGKYELMKDVFIGNLEYITSKYSRNYNHGCSREILFDAGNLTYWIGWESDHSDLDQIEKFYNENLFYQISIFENEAVYFKSVFRGRNINGDFFHHHIVFETDKDEIEKKYANCELKIKMIKELKRDWYYIIEQI